MSSASLEKGEVLIINTMGLELNKSERKALDGFTYFGCKKSVKKPIKSTNHNMIFGNNNKQMA